MTHKITNEQHKILKMLLMDIMKSASKIQDIIEEDNDLLVIVSEYFVTSIKFSAEMIRRGYGDN